MHVSLLPAMLPRGTYPSQIKVRTSAFPSAQVDLVSDLPKSGFRTTFSNLNVKAVMATATAPADGDNVDRSVVQEEQLGLPGSVVRL